VQAPLETLLYRYALARVPFSPEAPAARFGLPLPLIIEALDALVSQGRLVRGPFHPRVEGQTYCEAELLRRIRRRMLARLRSEVAPVDGPTFTRFIAEWQGLRDKTRAPTRLLETLTRLEGLPLPLSEWESRILPARVPGYRCEDLDHLLTSGAIVWVGVSPLGSGDGRLAFYRRALLDTTLTPAPLDSAVLEPLHLKIVDYLSRMGSAFIQDLLLRVAQPIGVSAPELESALWDLVWQGHLVNDTFLPARGLLARGGSKRRGGQLLGGRWSLTGQLLYEPTGDTERLLACTMQVIERYGILTREVLEAEVLQGGFGAIYPTLKALEDMNRVRRGHFVEGTQGMQFALPGVVDRLRAMREPLAEGEAPEPLLLAATDPANPYGALLPWPETAEGASKPKRQAGASVILAGGRPLFWVSPRGDRLTSFPAAREDDSGALAGLEALAPLAAARRHLELTVRAVDGEDPRLNRWGERLRLAGFKSDHRGLTLFVTRPRPSARPGGGARAGFAPPELGYGPKESPPSSAVSGPTADPEAIEDRYARRFALRRKPRRGGGRAGEET